MATQNQPKHPPAQGPETYVGTLVGESTSTEFRLAVAQGTVREQDLIAVDAELERPDGGAPESIRVWAKVKRIERLNPLFPTESGHELAATKTNPFDTVLSLSREMVSAVCQVLGSESREEAAAGKLNQLRYPAKPATSAYRPESADITRIVVGKLQDPINANRAVDFAHLANRDDVHVSVDGHAIVLRHLAILAMTGSGKTWTARRIIEQLAAQDYPIVIFDPHGDYSGLGEVPGLESKVRCFYAQFPIVEQDPDAVLSVVEALAGRELAENHRNLFPAFFAGLKEMAKSGAIVRDEVKEWFAAYLSRDEIRQYGLQPNLFFFAHLVAAVAKAGKAEDGEALDQLVTWTGRDELRVDKKIAGYIATMPGKLRFAASVLFRMERINKTRASGAQPLPSERKDLVRFGQISVVSLAGYTGDFQATIYRLVAQSIFEARVSGDLGLPVLLVLEEAHNFAPGHAETAAEKAAIDITRQIAQEGRKFQVGLLMISQRPNRLDETALSMCNSYVIMKMINPADQNFVRRVVESLGEDDVRMLTNLDKGEAILTGEFISFPVLVKVKPPASRGEREEEDAFVALAKMKAAADESDAAKAAKPKGR